MEVADPPFGSAQQHTGYLPDGIGEGGTMRMPLDLSAFGGGSYMPLPRHGGGPTGAQAPLDTLIASRLARERSIIGAQDRMGNGLSGCLAVARLVDQFQESRIEANGGGAAEQPAGERSLLGDDEEGGGIQAEGGVAAGQPEVDIAGDYQAVGGGGGGGGGFSHFIQPISYFDEPEEEEEDWLRCLDGLADLDDDFLMPDLDLHVPAIASANALAAFLGDGDGGSGDGGGGGGGPPAPPRDDSSAGVLLAAVLGPAAPNNEDDDLVEWMPAAGWAGLVRIGDASSSALPP